MPSVAHFLALWPRPASFLRACELMFTPLGERVKAHIRQLTRAPTYHLYITPPSAPFAEGNRSATKGYRWISGAKHGEPA